MRLILQKVRFRNFFSFGNEWTEIALDQAKTTLIVGKNGSGKSSAILDTISYALYGKPFRNITKPQLTNSINGKNMLVELDFIANGHQFRVRRGIKPNVFEIYKDDELLTQTADVRDYQDAFEKYILKVNHKTFCQVVILGSAIFIPFMALPAAQRRSVIEDLLDLQIFSNMNVILKERIAQVDSQINSKQNQKNVLDERLRLTEEHIAQLQSNREQEITWREAELDRAERDIQEFKQRMRRFEQAIEEDTKLYNESDAIRRFEKIDKLQYQLGVKIISIEN
jgi:DNA repair exonuclease SbcCD ATPase subunit